MKLFILEVYLFTDEAWDEINTVSQKLKAGEMIEGSAIINLSNGPGDFTVFATPEVADAIEALGRGEDPPDSGFTWGYAAVFASNEKEAWSAARIQCPEARHYSVEKVIDLKEAKRGSCFTF